jgi:cupin 2 domain-containing protein
MPEAPNLLADIPAALPEELFTALINHPSFRVERIVSHGHASPPGFWYDQPEDEWVLVVSGAARLRFEGEEGIELQSGSYVYIPAHRRHRVDWTTADEPTVWIAIHFGKASAFIPSHGGPGEGVNDAPRST